MHLPWKVGHCSIIPGFAWMLGYQTDTRGGFNKLSNLLFKGSTPKEVLNLVDLLVGIAMPKGDEFRM
jgi:hypothetical protein